MGPARFKLFANLKGRRVFWHFFLSYLAIVIVPVLIVGVVLYAYSIRMIEQQVQKSNVMAMGIFSHNTDRFFEEIKEQSIKLLNYPRMSFLIKEVEGDVKPFAIDTFERKQAIDELMVELGRMRDYSDMIQDAYLYFVKGNYVISSNDASIDGDYFFTYLNYYPDMTAAKRQEMFSERRRLSFQRTMEIQKLQYATKQLMGSEKIVSAITSFPFYSSPQVFLVVNIREHAFRDMIAASGSGSETVVLNEAGELISRTGEVLIDPRQLMTTIGGAKAGTSQMELQGKDMKLSFVQSDSNQWWYVSLTGLRELLRPTDFVKNISVATVSILCLLGIAASYLLSRKMYQPIHEIRHGLETSIPSRIDPGSGGRPDEFYRIKMLSRAIIYENREMSQQLNDIKPILDEISIGKILSGEYNNSTAITVSPDLGTAFEGSMLVCVIGIRFFTPFELRLSENEKRLHIIELKNRIVTEFDQRIWVTELYKQQLSCIIRLQDDADMGGLHVTERLKALLEKYAAFFKATVGVAQVVHSFSNLHESYKEAVRLLELKSFTPEIEVIRDGYMPGHFTNEGYLSMEEADRLMYLSRISDVHGLSDYISELLEKRAETDISAKYMLSIGQDILNSLFRVSSENSMDDYMLEKYSVLGHKLRMCVSLEELRAFFGDIRQLLVSNKETKDARGEMFEEVVRYVQTHYDEELSLELLAGRYKMSLGYFSRSFKETIGEKYVDYVNKVRIAKAKDLLANTEMKIADIATAVGYIADRTFTTIFKKYEGITPGKYRTIRRG